MTRQVYYRWLIDQIASELAKRKCQITSAQRQTMLATLTDIDRQPADEYRYGWFDSRNGGQQSFQPSF